MTARAATIEQTNKRIISDPGLPRPNPTEAYWQLPAHSLSTIQSPSLPSSTDVLIIGSGITGCSVAKELLSLSPSLTITVLEARALCSGATGRNGGHIATHPVSDYAELVSAVGKEQAKKIIKFRLSHYDAIYNDLKAIGGNLIETSEIRRTESVCGLLDEEMLTKMKEMQDLFERENPEMEGRSKIFAKNDPDFEKLGMSGVAGIHVEPSAAVWPYRMITGIYAHLLKIYPHRLSIETQTPATSTTETLDGYEVTTPRGIIKARQIAYCTNGHTGHLLPKLRGKIFPLRGQMTVQAPGTKFPHIGNQRSWSLVWGHIGLDYMTQNPHTGEIFYGGGLVRGAQEGLISLGNSDDTIEDFFTLVHLSGVLPVSFGKENWGEDKGERVKSSWSGVMGFTADLLPLVGNLPEIVTERKGANEWIACGFNGYGMTNCWLSGKALATMMLGKDKDVEKWFPESYAVSEDRLRALKHENIISGLLGDIMSA